MEYPSGTQELFQEISALKKKIQELERSQTEHVLVEEALQESEQKFKDLSEKSLAGICLVQDGIFKYANSRLARMLGYEIDELTDKMSVRSAVFPADWPVVEENMRKRISGELESLHYEFRVVTKDKEVKDTEVYSSRTMYGGRAAIIGTYLDVTERKQMESALRDSEARWQFALEGAGDGVWDWDAVTGRVFFSPRWKAMLGYGEHEIGNTLDEWDRRVHPDDKAGVYADLERHFRRETAYYQNEHRLLCSDGSYKWILDRGKVIEWTEDGKPRRVIGTHTDITDRKQTEAERERLILELKEALSQVKTLKGLFPICASCKKIRNDKGYWEQIETYIRDHSEAEFSHSICPECAQRLYPQLYKKK